MRTLVPYIGITDFTNIEQVEKMLAVFKAHLLPGSKRRLHVGVMISYKTLNGLESRFTKAFPPKENIASIFGSDETYNCLHYADYDEIQTIKNISTAIGYGGTGIDAIQLDMIWPDPGNIAGAIHTSRKNIEVILQLGKNAIEEANEDPNEVVRRLQEYEGIIHRVLLDRSMGQGKSLDANFLLPFARAIRKAFPNLGLAVAGGLGPNSVDLIGPIISEFPNISIDAQGKLRPSGCALDPIDWDMAEQYLIKALRLLK